MTLIKATVTFNGLTEFIDRPTPDTIKQFIPSPEHKERARKILYDHGFTVTSESELTLSVKGEKNDFEKWFGTILEELSLVEFEAPFDSATPFLRKASRKSFWFPEAGKWNNEHQLKELNAEAYIQSPFYFSNNRFPREVSRFPPEVDYHHLRLPGDVAMALNASSLHREGITGKGVKIVILDSGFDVKHHHFTENGYSITPVLGPGANNLEKDPNGHGTAMAGNVLALAPGADVYGIKLLNDDDETHNTTGAEALEAALELSPDIISISLSWDLSYSDTERTHRERLLNNLKAVEGLIQLAISKNITVVCAAGNREVSFPAMIPEVIAVGGVYLTEKGEMIVSDYTSAFKSKIFMGRNVPDLCGLSGMKSHPKQEIPGGFIMSPVDESSKKDDLPDRTEGNDGWALMGGSSTATAQIAGICALILQKYPGLKPSEVKSRLKLKARDVKAGIANKESNQFKVLEAKNGPDDASGYGLADAYAAVTG